MKTKNNTLSVHLIWKERDALCFRQGVSFCTSGKQNMDSGAVIGAYSQDRDEKSEKWKFYI